MTDGEKIQQFRLQQEQEILRLRALKSSLDHSGFSKSVRRGAASVAEVFCYILFALFFTLGIYLMVVPVEIGLDGKPEFGFHGHTTVGNEYVDKLKLYLGLAIWGIGLLFFTMGWLMKRTRKRNRKIAEVIAFIDQSILEKSGIAIS